ncbi:MAG: galactokinase family protein [Caldilineaceae bacterium]
MFRPRRVNLIGEHTDYNHGFVMPAALDKDILLLARLRADGAVNLANVESRFAPFSFTIETEIPIGAPGHWGNYVRGRRRC